MERTLSKLSKRFRRGGNSAVPEQLHSPTRLESLQATTAQHSASAAHSQSAPNDAGQVGIAKFIGLNRGASGLRRTQSQKVGKGYINPLDIHHGPSQMPDWRTTQPAGPTTHIECPELIATALRPYRDEKGKIVLDISMHVEYPMKFHPFIPFYRRLAVAFIVDNARSCSEAAWRRIYRVIEHLLSDNFFDRLDMVSLFPSSMVNGFEPSYTDPNETLQHLREYFQMPLAGEPGDLEAAISRAVAYLRKLDKAGFDPHDANYRHIVVFTTQPSSVQAICASSSDERIPFPVYIVCASPFQQPGYLDGLGDWRSNNILGKVDMHPIQKPELQWATGIEESHVESSNPEEQEVDPFLEGMILDTRALLSLIRKERLPPPLEEVQVTLGLDTLPFQIRGVSDVAKNQVLWKSEMTYLYPGEKLSFNVRDHQLLDAISPLNAKLLRENDPDRISAIINRLLLGRKLRLYVKLQYSDPRFPMHKTQISQTEYIREWIQRSIDFDKPTMAYLLCRASELAQHKLFQRAYENELCPGVACSALSLRDREWQFMKELVNDALFFEHHSPKISRRHVRFTDLALTCRSNSLGEDRSMGSHHEAASRAMVEDQRAVSEASSSRHGLTYNSSVRDGKQRASPRHEPMALGSGSGDPFSGFLQRARELQPTGDSVYHQRLRAMAAIHGLTVTFDEGHTQSNRGDTVSGAGPSGSTSARSRRHSASFSPAVQRWAPRTDSIPHVHEPQRYGRTMRLTPGSIPTSYPFMSLTITAPLPEGSSQVRVSRGEYGREGRSKRLVRFEEPST